MDDENSPSVDILKHICVNMIQHQLSAYITYHQTYIWRYWFGNIQIQGNKLSGTIEVLNSDY